jgi:DNA recombination protein RmuC
MALAYVILGFLLGAIAAWLAARARTGGEIVRLQTELEHEREGTAEKIAVLESARHDLETTMKALAADALRSNNESFLELARTQLEAKEKAVEHLVTPLKESLDRISQQTQLLESERQKAYGSLSQQLRLVAETQEHLRGETANLVTALRSPVVRGRWGEIQLRRVVEMAGMVAHCDFLEQQTAHADGVRLRPDLIVKLPGGKSVVVDAKAPLQAYLDSLDAKDESIRAARLADHARQIRDHIGKLSAKSYWGQFEQTPEFVVLFIPGETFFSAALEQDPSLIEEGVSQQVILATPTTLIALLRAVHYGWRQEKIADSARAISELGRDLYSRMGTLTEHFAKVGRGLESAVRAYNDSVGSLEQRVLPSARKFKQHGIAPTAELAELTAIDRAVREVQAPERSADEPPALPNADAA